MTHHVTFPITTLDSHSHVTLLGWWWVKKLYSKYPIRDNWSLRECKYYDLPNLTPLMKWGGVGFLTDMIYVLKDMCFRGQGGREGGEKGGGGHTHMCVCGGGGLNMFFRRVL